MAFALSTKQFSGPLDLLLELIERRDLPITEVALSEVTEEYLRYMQLQEVPIDELADFLLIASRLLLLKSHAVLPEPVLEEEELDLAQQLKMYKRFVEASKQVERLYAAPARLFGRPKTTVKRAPEFAPPSNVNSITLYETFMRFRKRLEPLFALQHTSIERVISVQERIGQIREAILGCSRLTFKDVIGGARSKVEVVVSFLALLELVKGRVVSVMQSGHLGDIEIKHIE